MDKHGWNDPDHWDAAIANYEEQAHPFTSLFAQAALEPLALAPSTRVLDIATGMGAAAVAAAGTGADVVAIDFSAGMVRRVASYGLPNIEARQMDGQALELPDASFDVSLSIFGVMLFPDWRQGLREMARVTKPGGTGIVATWKSVTGAGTYLLLSEVRSALFPELAPPPPPAGMAAMSDPERFRAELVAAGFEEPAIREVTHDFRLRLDKIDDAERLFSHIPPCATLSPEQQAAVIGEVRARAARESVGDVLPIPSTALIATARRP